MEDTEMPNLMKSKHYLEFSGIHTLLNPILLKI